MKETFKLTRSRLNLLSRDKERSQIQPDNTKLKRTQQEIKPKRYNTNPTDEEKTMGKSTSPQHPDLNKDPSQKGTTTTRDDEAKDQTHTLHTDEPKQSFKNG